MAYWSTGLWRACQSKNRPLSGEFRFSHEDLLGKPVELRGDDGREGGRAAEEVVSCRGVPTVGPCGEARRDTP